MRLKKKELYEFCKKETEKLDESKVYIVHIKLNLKGIKSILNPYAFLIQAAAVLNNDYKINHTALIYGIYKDKMLGKTAKYLEATLFGIRCNSFHYLIEKVNANKGEIWLEEVPFIKLDGKDRKWVINLVEKRILGGKYNILKAIGSQSFKSKFFIPVNLIFNLIGKMGMKKEGFFCTEIVKVVLDEILNKVQKKESLKSKKFKGKKAAKVYPAKFFGACSDPKKIL